jgi:hypothetical protein
MDWAAFFRTTPPALREELPAELRAFQWNSTSWMAKAWYGNRALHYEIWVRHSAKVVELGLHFEADELTNARLLGAFRMRAKVVRRALGAGARIEEWDKGWSRIWEPFPLRPLDDELAERIRSRFVDYVRVLEPILEEELPAEVPWKVKAISSRASRSARR